MTKIDMQGYHITCSGHAGNTICCAMLTALSVSLVENITERICDDINYDLRDGYFDIDATNAKAESKALVNAYAYSLASLCKSYPMNFSWICHEGS